MENIDYLGLLCSGHLDERLVLTVFDHEGSGKHELMGEIETSANGLIGAKRSGKGFVLKRKGKDMGNIAVHTAEVCDGEGEDDLQTKAMNNVHITPTAPPLPQPIAAGRPAFTDYVRGGCEINLCVAIDFTGSNGDPRQPGTLHYIYQDGRLNDYEKAIKSVGSVLTKYNQDQKFPVVRFGARYRGVVRHCFQCGPQEEVDGVNGILVAYRQTFKAGLVMSGPTVITEVIQTAAARAISTRKQPRKRASRGTPSCSF